MRASFSIRRTRPRVLRLQASMSISLESSYFTLVATTRPMRESTSAARPTLTPAPTSILSETCFHDRQRIIHVRKIIGAFVNRALFKGKGRLHEVCLLDRAVISCFRAVSEPGRNTGVWSVFILSLGRHGRPRAIGAQPTVIGTD